MSVQFYFPVVFYIAGLFVVGQVSLFDNEYQGFPVLPCCACADRVIPLPGIRCLATALTLLHKQGGNKMKLHGFIKETDGSYTLSRAINNEDILSAAREILGRRFRRGKALTNAQASSDYLISQIAHLEHEVFLIVFLDNKHQILATEIMFQGTIDGASVYPREVVKRALQLNSAALILSHNHPSGNFNPSQADKAITQKLVDALKLVEIRILDHLIVAGTETYSFAEHGLI